MSIKNIAIVVFSAFVCHSVFAGGMQNEPDSCWGNVGSCREAALPEATPWLRVTALSAGPGWTNNGETQTFYLQTGVQKTYYAGDTQTTLFDGELFYGAQHAINAVYFGQVGVALAAASNAHLSGHIWEDTDPSFNNYEYQYDVNHAHLALKGKLLAEFGQFAQPYVSASLGIGANRSHDFSITPLIYQEVPAPAFQNHTTMAFAYTLGFGGQTALSEHWQIGMGYELTSWGESKLDPASGQTMGIGLKLSNVYVNALRMTLSYTS